MDRQVSTLQQRVDEVNNKVESANFKLNQVTNAVDGKLDLMSTNKRGQAIESN